MKKQMNRKLNAALMLAAAAGIGFYAVGHYNDRVASNLAALEPTAGRTVGEAAVGGDFTLTDQDGKTVTDATYNGKYRMVFFGFSSCPDVCPAGLKKIGAAMELLKTDAAKVQPLFITLDPLADTPAVMKDYVALYGNMPLVGLTGTQEQIDNVQKEYKVYAAKVQNKADGTYTMDHSSFIYLMGPDGKFLTVFGMDEDAKAIADSVRHYIQAT